MNLIKIINNLPPMRFNASTLQSQFYMLALRIDAKRYLTFIFLISLLIPLITYIIFPNVYVILLFPSILIFLYYLPSIKIMEKERAMEEEIAIFLRDLGTLINMKIPFLRAMQMASNKDTELGKEIKRMVSEVKRGASLPYLLGNFASRLNSSILKRAFAQIIVAYQGSSGNELKRMSNEILNQQRHKLREYAAKISLMGQLFVFVVVVIPAFFLIFSVVSPIIFNSPFNETNFFVILDILMPIIAYVLIIINKAMLPATSFKRAKGKSLSLPLAILAAAVFLTNFKMEEKIAVLIGLIIISLALVLREYVKTKQIVNIEKNLPEALFIMSTMPKGLHLERIIERVAYAGIPHVSKEFKKVLNEVKGGVSIEKALINLAENIDSPILKRIIEVLLNAFRSGENISERIAELADDILAYYDIKREQSAMLAMQKYTLIASLIILPIVFAIGYSMSLSMSSMINASIPFLKIKEAYVPTYFILISALVAYYSSELDNDYSKEILYFSLLALTANLIFFNLNFSSMITG